MKKLLLFSAIIIMALGATAQAKPKQDTAAKVVKPAPQPYFAIILTAPELDQLWKFIQLGDLWSDKGKQTFLDDLAKKIRVIPADTTLKK